MVEQGGLKIRLLDGEVPGQAEELEGVEIFGGDGRATPGEAPGSRELPEEPEVAGGETLGIEACGKFLDVGFPVLRSILASQFVLVQVK